MCGSTKPRADHGFRQTEDRSPGLECQQWCQSCTRGAGGPQYCLRGSRPTEPHAGSQRVRLSSVSTSGLPGCDVRPTGLVLGLAAS